MKQTHMIQDKGSKLFFRRNEDDTKPTPCVPRYSDGNRFEPDLFSENQAHQIAEEFYGAVYDKRCVISEASATDFMKFIGRSGGEKSSPKKTRANRLNARNKRKRHATTQTSGPVP